MGQLDLCATFPSFLGFLDEARFIRGSKRAGKTAEISHETTETSASFGARFQWAGRAWKVDKRGGTAGLAAKSRAVKRSRARAVVSLCPALLSQPKMSQLFSNTP